MTMQDLDRARDAEPLPYLSGDLTSILDTLRSLRVAWKQLDEADPEAFREARKRALRRHAIETGVLEGLYDLSWGTTELRRVARAQLDQHDRMADDGVQDAMATLEGEPPIEEESFGDYDPGDLASRPSVADLDADTDDYVTQGGEQPTDAQLSTV